MPTYVARVSAEDSDVELLPDGDIVSFRFCLSTAALDERGRVLVGTDARGAHPVGEDGVRVLYGDHLEVVVLVQASDEGDVERRVIRTWGPDVDVDDICEAALPGDEPRVPSSESYRTTIMQSLAHEATPAAKETLRALRDDFGWTLPVWIERDVLGDSRAGASRRVMVVARFDVSGLESAEVDYLIGEISAQADRSDGHGSLPTPAVEVL